MMRDVITRDTIGCCSLLCLLVFRTSPISCYLSIALCNCSIRGATSLDCTRPVHALECEASDCEISLMDIAKTWH